METIEQDSALRKWAGLDVDENKDVSNVDRNKEESDADDLDANADAFLKSLARPGEIN